MLKNILTVLRKLASAAMNFLIVYFETIAVPMSWAMGGTIMFTMYTELSNKMCIRDRVCPASDIQITACSAGDPERYPSRPSPSR